MASSRRLAAIMFTDMVGFTRGTQLDERASLGRLAEQEGLVRPLIAHHQGRVVKSTGDGLLAEFPSALKATECAVTIQEELHRRNATRPGTPIELRIGIHLGDVEQRGEDIFGDAVNLAARVQPTAEAGGIAISQQVLDQVHNKLPLRFEALPPQTLKGVQAPMAIFRVVLPWKGSTGAGPPPASSGRLAVLPFTNISPDPRDAYFSDGLTEEVIDVLSELKELRVIARTSVDHYKSAPPPIPQVGAELGVRWVLQGSVRKDGSRLRFTAQLVDVGTQEHVWAGKYDRELVDLFALQSELARQIAEALKLRLLSGETDRLARRRAPQPDSYLEYLQGRTSLHQFSEEALRAAQDHFERAIALDGTNASAYAGLAEAVTYLAGIYHTMSRVEAEREAQRLTARALELDPDLAEAHTMAGSTLADMNQYVEGLEEVERAIALNPSYPLARVYHGSLLADLGRPEEALREYEVAEQLDPLATLPYGEEVALLAALGRFDAARSKLARLGELEQHGLLYHDRAGLLAVRSGDYEAYRAHIDWFEQRYPSRHEIPVARAMYAALTGQPDRARQLLQGPESLPEGERPTPGIPYVYAVLGDIDRCFAWIEKTVEERRFAPRGWLYDPTRAPIRQDPRFGALLRRLGIPEPAPSGR